jgi:hypothetical protein
MLADGRGDAGARPARVGRGVVSIHGAAHHPHDPYGRAIDAAPTRVSESSVHHPSTPMAQNDDGSTPRKGKLSAFQLLKSWLFDKSSGPRAPAETEFLNTRDGYELAKFAQKAFGNDDAAKQAQRAAVDAEQAEIDALLQGTGAVPMPTALAAKPATPPAMTRSAVDVAVKHLEALRAQGLSVETLAEALIIIESREVKERANKAA